MQYYRQPENMSAATMAFRHWMLPILLQIAILLCAFLPIQADPVTNIVPFSDDFESYEHNTPLIDGTNGWYASDTSVVAQTNTVYGGEKAALIPTDTFLTNRFDEEYTFQTNQVWLEMYLLPALLESTEPPECDPDVAASLYLDNEGYFVVRNATQWQTITQNVFGGSCQMDTNNVEWARVSLRMDYGNHKWWLFVDGTPLLDNINFADSGVESLSALDVYNGATTSYLDNVGLTYDTPPGLTNLVDLNVSVTSVFRSVREGNNAATAIFELWNTVQKADGGHFQMRYTNSIDYGSGPTDWLTLTPNNGTVYGTRAAIEVSFNTIGLPVSDTPYTATIRVEGKDTHIGMPAQESPREIHVELWVRATPKLGVAPLELHADINWGGTAPPAQLQVANIGNEPLDAMSYIVNATTQNGGNWLQVAPNVGISTGNWNTLTVSYQSASLDGGIYKGTIEVISEGAEDSPVEVPVTLQVTHKPVPAWDLGTIIPDLNASITEGAALANRQFHVWNSSEAPVGRMRYEVFLSDDLRAWVKSVTPITGVTTGDANRLTVQYQTENLQAGIYTGTLTIRGIDDWTGIHVGDIATNLTLRVVGRAALVTSTNRVDATVLENLTTNATLKLWNGAGEPRRGMRYQITPAFAWASFNPLTGEVQDNAATVNANFTPGALVPGTYTGEILIDAWDVEDGMRAIGAPLIMPVRLTVVSRLPVNYERPEIMGMPYIGQDLQAWSGIWNNMGRLRFEYQWERANDVSGSGRIITRNWTDTPNYLVTTADRGKYLRVSVRAIDDLLPPKSATADSVWRHGKVVPVPGDFDGDGRTDLWFFNSADANWHAALSAGGTGRVLFGAPNLIPIPGDYDGNGYLDLALYDPANGMWHAMLLPQWKYVSGWLGWIPGVTPVPRDYSGNGTTDLAVYWEQHGHWYIYHLDTKKLEHFVLGGPGAVPVPGDYDGDGAIDAAVYYTQTGRWLVRGADGRVWEQYLGGSGAVPVTCDYDGDGKQDLCVYWPASNRWQILLSDTAVLHEESFGVSNGRGMPIPGYYDRDRFCDLAHAHISDDFIIWSVRLSNFTNYFTYRGQSYQISTDYWRVSW